MFADDISRIPDFDKISAYFRDVYDLEIKSDDELGSIIDRFDCYETSPESVDAFIHRDYSIRCFINNGHGTVQLEVYLHEKNIPDDVVN